MRFFVKTIVSKAVTTTLYRRLDVGLKAAANDMGKAAVDGMLEAKLTNLAYSAALDGKKVAYFDLENDDGDFIRRQVAKKASIKLNNTSNTRRSSKDYEKLRFLSNRIRYMI